MLSIPVRLLLVEDHPGDARLLAEIVGQFPGGRFEVVHERTLAKGMRRLEEEESIGCVLLDLSMPNCRGLSAFQKLRDQEFNVPILVLSDFHDEELAVKAVQEGAQDFLVKSELRPDSLYRAIRYAMERHQLHSGLFATSLIDPLTGLYNRRGFFKLTRQEMKTADRLHHGLLLLYMDVKGMEDINVRFGMKEGDRALSRTAELIRSTFRASDIPGRIGGDEFVLLALNADQAADRVIARLKEAFDRYNEHRDHEYELRVSIGYARYPDGTVDTSETLLERAKEMMGGEKARKSR